MTDKYYFQTQWSQLGVGKRQYEPKREIRSLVVVLFSIVVYLTYNSNIAVANSERSLAKSCVD